MAQALTDFGSVLTAVADFITDQEVLYTMFVGGLLVVGAKVFKKIKKAAT